MIIQDKAKHMHSGLCFGSVLLKNNYRKMPHNQKNIIKFFYKSYDNSWMI